MQKSRYESGNFQAGNENITVWLSGGEYRLSETLVFRLEDAPAHGYTISYEALPGETPVINSDITLTGWKKMNKAPLGLSKQAKGKVWVAPVPESAGIFKTVYNANGSLPRARTKAIAHLRESQDWRGSKEYHEMIPFEKGTTENLFNPQNAELLVVPAAPWTMNILPVNRWITKAGWYTWEPLLPTPLPLPAFIWARRQSGWRIHLPAWTKPGEWVYDAEERLALLLA